MKRVLLIEDDEKIAQYICLKLQKEGYNVDLAGDGVEGFEKARDHDYDVLIINLILPKKDGIEILREIKPFKPGIRSVIITGYPKAQTLREAVELGVEDYLPKSFDISKLLKILKSIPDKV